MAVNQKKQLKNLVDVLKPPIFAIGISENDLFLYRNEGMQHRNMPQVMEHSPFTKAMSMCIFYVAH